MLRRTLMHALISSAALALLAIAAFFAVATYETPATARQARSTIRQISTKAGTLLDASTTTIKNANETVSMWRGTSRLEELAARKQINSVADFQRQMSATMAAAQAFLKRTSDSVNGPRGTLPAATAELQALRGATSAVQRQVDNLAPAVRGAGASMANLDRFTATLPATGRHLVQTSANFQRTSANTAAITGDLAAVAAHYERVLTSAKTKLQAIFGAASHWLAVFLGQLL